jgi:glycosyltransferase involved in cell wall biosynthesis
MKILINYTVVGRGGDAIQMLSLAEGFRSLGHQVSLIGPSPLRPYEFVGAEGRVRGQLRRLPWWAKDIFELGLNLISLWRAQRLLRHEAIDLIYHRAGIYDFIGAHLAEHYPLVAHLDAPFPVERAFRGEGYFKKLHQRSMQSLGQRVQYLATISAASKAYYVQLGLPQEKIFILPNGVLARLLHWGLQQAQNRPPFGQGPPWTIGFVGSFSRWHRVDLLLEALHLLNAGSPGLYRLIAVGAGEEFANLRAQEKRLGLEENVSWLGPMPHEQAFRQIAQFDIAVLPHTLSTGAPMKLFEYAAVARPAIAPDVPNVRGLFADDEMYFVQPERPQALAEAILELSGKQEAARQLGLRAQKRAQQHTWENTLARLLREIHITI